MRMPVLVALLRGINVGGHHKIAMPALRELFGSLGLRDVGTYVQSGNLVFRAAGKAARLAGQLEGAMQEAFGFPVPIVLRTAGELRAVVEGNPFAGRPEVSGGKLHVVFLARDPGEPARQAVRQIRCDPEELFAEGRELYIHYPNGMGRSKLTGAVLERRLQMPGTARNWNTVVALLEMAEELEQKKGT